MPTANGYSGKRSQEADQFRGGRIRTMKRTMAIATWNVEGLTESKILELQEHMSAGRYYQDM